MQMEEQKHIFSNRDLYKLLIPVMAEQLLNSLMGTADSIMVSNVGPAAISAVSLVDSINVLIIQALSALATGGVIVCSNFIGQKRPDQARESAKQLSLVALAISVVIMILSMCLRMPLLHLIFGKVEPAVMTAASTYFFYTILSFPAIAMYNSGAAIYQAQRNTRLPMLIAVFSNALNIAGNAWLIWGMHMGVAGAAIATLVSRIVSAVAVYAFLHREGQEIYIRNYAKTKPDLHRIGTILALGIPNGIETSMFQFGKLAIQSTVSTLGTTAMAAQAMTAILESLNGVAGIGVGIGLMTVVGQCIGAGRKDEARYYVKKLAIWGEAVVTICCIVIYLLARPITMLAGMTQESADMCLFMIGWITIVKPLVWTASFIPGYGMRAAGDVKFSMILSTASMWIFRVSLCTFLCRVMGFGPIAVWIGMFTDWTVRGIFFLCRFRSGKWLAHKVV
jgi:putative MATE family efflux protein